MASTASPTLKLVIEKGPRSGETLEFNSKSTVRIGRVVRGNNLPIKDAGISSKHLAIEFDSDSGKWLITDLDSSNGTILNTSQLKPFSPFELRDGDEIKIGELTSIKVEIVEIGGEICHRRNPRRQAAPKSGLDLGAKVEVVDEKCPNLGDGGFVRVRDENGYDVQKGVDSGVNVGRDNRKGRGRGRPKKESVLVEGNTENKGNIGVNENVEDVNPKQVGEVATRRTRNSKREGEEFFSLPEPIPARRTRSMKNAEKVQENEASDVGNSKVENVGLVESKKTRGRGRKKKLDVVCSDNPKDVILEDRAITEMSKLEVQDVREQPHEEPMGDTVHQYALAGEVAREVSAPEVPDVRERPLEEPIGDIVQHSLSEGKKTIEEPQLNVPDIKEKPHGEPMEDRMIEKVPEPDVEEQVGSVLDVKGQPYEQPMDNTVRENDNAVGASHCEQDMYHTLESDTVLEDGRVEEIEMGEVSEELDTDVDGGDENQEAGDAPDLEKMTLGEWFDYLEVYLPKQIHTVTDEIIVDMRKRAKEFDDFMLQQQNQKGELPIVT